MHLVPTPTLALLQHRPDGFLRPRAGRPSCWGRTPSSGCSHPGSPGVSLDVLVNEGAELWQCPLLLEMVPVSTHRRVETSEPFVTVVLSDRPEGGGVSGVYPTYIRISHSAL